MLEAVLQFFLELLLQLVLEVLAEFGLRSLSEPFRKPPNPWVAALGYAIFGATAGGISLYVVPDSLIHGETGRWLNLIATPILAGLAMAALGAWRSRRGQQTIRIDRFSYGYLFALCMALVRFFLAG